MQFKEEHGLIADMVAHLCADEVRPRVEERDKNKAFPKEEIDALFAHGLRL